MRLEISTNLSATSLSPTKAASAITANEKTATFPIMSETLENNIDLISVSGLPGLSVKPNHPLSYQNSPKRVLPKGFPSVSLLFCQNCVPGI